MDNTMKKRWISLYVENQVGVLSKISGLFSGKSYNLESLTVGRTEDPTISRMTIETNSDEETYEQIKKQLNRTVEVIRVIDFTEVSVVMQELMFIKVKNCTPEDKTELFQIAQTYQAKVRDYGKAVRRGCGGTSAVAGCDRAGEESLSVLRAAAVCGGTAQREMVPHGQRISGGGRRTDLGTGRRIRTDPGDPSVTGSSRLRQGAAGGDGALPGAGF